MKKGTVKSKLASLLSAAWLSTAGIGAAHADTSQDTQKDAEVYEIEADKVTYENHLELTPAVAEPIERILELIVEHSPVPGIQQKYDEIKHKLGFAYGDVKETENPGNPRRVVVAFVDDNGNGIFDHETGEERMLFPIPNNQFLNIPNSPFMPEVYERWVKAHENFLNFRVMTDGGIDENTWAQYWFQDKDDYTIEEDTAFRQQILDTAAAGLKQYQAFIPARVIKEFTDRFGSLDSPQVSDEDTYLLDYEVFDANGDWYICLFDDDNFNGVRDADEKLVNVIQDSRITPFIKIDTPDCPTIVGRGPTCLAEDEGYTAAAGKTSSEHGGGDVADATQKATAVKEKGPEYTFGLESTFQAQVGDHGRVPEPNQGDFNLGVRLFHERVYGELSGALSANKRDPRGDQNGAKAEFVPAELLTARLVIKGSLGYKFTDSLRAHVTGGVAGVSVQDPGKRNQVFGAQSQQLSQLVGGGVVVSLFGDSLALRGEYTFEEGDGATAQAYFPNGNTQKFNLDNVRAHNILLQATALLSDRVFADLYAKTEGNSRLFFLEGSSGAYGRVAVGGTVGYVVGTENNDFLKIGVGVKQTQSDFIPLYANNRSDTFVGMFMSSGPVSDRSKAYVVQNRE